MRWMTYIPYEQRYENREENLDYGLRDARR